MKELFKTILTVGLVGLCTSAWAQDLKKVTILSGPLVDWDAIWMADSNGFFKEEGLDATISVFPSGTTALQTFQSGVGDIVGSGDLPSINHWNKSGKDYRVISIISRSTQMSALATNDIQKPEDLIGKSIGTRVGSTGSWFVSEFLARNGLDEDSVEVLNLDTSAMPAALCGGDLAALFIWEPFPSRTKSICPDKVHTLAEAADYVAAYSMLGARASWLQTEEGKDIATRVLRALLKGKEAAAADFDGVAAYAESMFGQKAEDIKTAWENSDRVQAFDGKFYDDFCKLSKWMVGEELLTNQLDFNGYIWESGLKSIDPALALAPPASCN